MTLTYLYQIHTFEFEESSHERLISWYKKGKPYMAKLFVGLPIPNDFCPFHQIWQVDILWVHLCGSGLEVCFFCCSTSFMEHLPSRDMDGLNSFGLQESSEDLTFPSDAGTRILMELGWCSSFMYACFIRISLLIFI